MNRSLVAFLILSVLIATSVSLLATIYRSSKKEPGVVIVKPKDPFETSSYTWYMADVYVNDQIVKTIGVRVSKPGFEGELWVSLWGDAVVKSIQVEFIAPFNRVPDVAWIAELGFTPSIRFYRDGNTVTWECSDLPSPSYGGKLGATWTWRFIPLDDLSGYSIHVKAVLIYDGATYQAEYTFGIP
jgi:hypothetical protein